jgi:hypothetical protein
VRASRFWSLKTIPLILANENRLWIDEWLGEEQLSLPLAVYVRFVPERDFEDMNEELEIVARIKNNQHRSIRPTTNTGF